LARGGVRLVEREQRAILAQRIGPLPDPHIGAREREPRLQVPRLTLPDGAPLGGRLEILVRRPETLREACAKLGPAVERDRLPIFFERAVALAGGLERIRQSEPRQRVAPVRGDDRGPLVERLVPQPALAEVSCERDTILQRGAADTLVDERLQAGITHPER